MNIFHLYKQLLKRSPAVRILSAGAIILLALGATALIGKNVNRKPLITSIDPTLGSPGDIMTIKGNFFGNSRGTSYVEIAGSRITAQGYIEWTDNQIQVLLPASV
ncbi:IPT/TIG domain-containing protein, partial [Treponema sp.]|uniref:IPT/TIG domain-containing protein n=1 Tax=Treponema sp. TaxID=166 RepID=UPI0025F5043E